jgi:hypothetical protein
MTGRWRTTRASINQKKKISGNGCLGRGCSNGSNSGGSLSAMVALTTAEAAADDVRQGGGREGHLLLFC